MLKQYLETGKIVGTHGVRGEMRVQPWSDTPQFLTAFKRFFTDKQGANRLDVQSVRAHGNMVLLKVKGVDDIPAAEALRGRVLYIDRRDVRLEKGAHFVQDLIGCTVVDDADGHEYGTVSDVSATGANDVWHIKSGEREYLIPNIPDVVRSVDVEAGRIVIHAMRGLFDDED